MLELILGILFGVFLGIIGLSAIILRNNAVPFEALREPPSELQPLQSTSHYSDWKEVVWSRIWNEWIHDELVRRQMAEVFTRVLNKDRPSCLAPITVVPNYSRLSLALSAPELVETAYPDQVKLLFSLHTRGEVTLDIQTKFSGIPLTVHAVARNLVGKAELHIPPGNNPLCTLCFSSQPHVSFALLAAPSFTSSLIRLNDVPFLGEYLEKRVHRAIREYLVICCIDLPLINQKPMGCCFRIPIPKTRALCLHLVSTLYNHRPPLPPRPRPSAPPAPTVPDLMPEIEGTPQSTSAVFAADPKPEGAPLGPPPPLPPRPSQRNESHREPEPIPTISPASSDPGPPSPPLPPRPPHQNSCHLEPELTAPFCPTSDTSTSSTLQPTLSSEPNVRAPLDSGPPPLPPRPHKNHNRSNEDDD